MLSFYFYGIYFNIITAEGESCVSMMLLGAPQTTECALGLHCDRTTMKCTADGMWNETLPKKTLTIY